MNKKKINGATIRQKNQKDLISLENKLNSLKAEKRKRIISNLKIAGIRNLKFCKHSLNFLLPYAVVAGLTIGGFKLCNGGLPFKKDDVIKFRQTDLDYQTKESVMLTEHYRGYHWFTNELSPSSLKIVFPYKHMDGEYTRIIRTYNVECTEDLIMAVLNNDTNKIEELLPKYDEEREHTNQIASQDNEAEIYAEIHYLDKKQVLSFPESDFKNNMITIIETLITLILASLAAYARDFSYLESLKETKEKYPKESLDSINMAINKNKTRTRVLRKLV